MTNNQNNNFSLLLKGLSESLDRKDATETKCILHDISRDYSDWKSRPEIAVLYNEHLPKCLNDTQNTQMQELLFADILDINRKQEVKLNDDVGQSCRENFQAVQIHIKIKILELLALYKQTIENMATDDLRDIVDWYNGANDDDVGLFNSQVEIYKLLMKKTRFRRILIKNVVYCAREDIKPRCTTSIIKRLKLLKRLRSHTEQLKAHHTMTTHCILNWLNNKYYFQPNNNEIHPIYSDNGGFNNNQNAIVINFSKEIDR